MDNAKTRAIMCNSAEQYMCRIMGKPTIWFLNRSDTNRAVQGFRNWNSTVLVAKPITLISFAVTVNHVT